MIRLFKLAFLLREFRDTAPRAGLYEFLPYLHGPYSFTLRYELGALERDGWLRVEGNHVHLIREIDKENTSLDERFAAAIDALSRRFRAVSIENLIASVYKSYPWYTVNALDEKRRSNSRVVASPAVFTVGYEGLMLDGFLDLLLRSGIQRLIDVRRNPIARRFGFHKSTLERHCKDVQISYVHFPKLGISSAHRSTLTDANSYSKLFASYKASTLSEEKATLNVVSELLREAPSALMCMEADVRCCHRGTLAEWLAKQTGLERRELRSICDSELMF